MKSESRKDLIEEIHKILKVKHSPLNPTQKSSTKRKRSTSIASKKSKNNRKSPKTTPKKRQLKDLAFSKNQNYSSKYKFQTPKKKSKMKKKSKKIPKIDLSNFSEKKAYVTKLLSEINSLDEKLKIEEQNLITEEDDLIHIDNNTPLNSTPKTDKLTKEQQENFEKKIENFFLKQDSVLKEKSKNINSSPISPRSNSKRKSSSSKQKNPYIRPTKSSQKLLESVMKRKRQKEEESVNFTKRKILQRTQDFYSKYEILSVYDEIIKSLKLPKVSYGFRPKKKKLSKLIFPLKILFFYCLKKLF